VALRLSDVRRDPVANRALEELTRRYTVSEGSGGLVLTQRTGNMRLFVHELDDLHQWDFIWNLRLREFLLAIDEQRETWKRRAMEAERKLAEAADNVPSAPGWNVSDVRYGALRRYLAKQFHPDHAPGYGIEKVVRNEIFKEIWGEIERLNHQAASPSATRART
jgi:hypothetical protein